MSPVAYWKMEETSGTSAADSSGNSYGGTYINSPTLDQTSLVASDPAGNSVLFNGLTQYVDIGFNSQLVSATNGTLALSFKPETDATTSLLFYSGNLAGEYRLSIYARSTNTFAIYFRDSSGESTVETDISWSAGNIYHLVFFSDGAMWGVYVNGVQATLSVVTGDNDGRWLGDLPAPTGIFIGAQSVIGSVSGYADGFIDDVALFNTLLTSAEISTLYQKTLALSSQPSITIGAPASNLITNVVYIKPINAISATNLSSTWEG